MNRRLVVGFAIALLALAAAAPTAAASPSALPLPVPVDGCPECHGVNLVQEIADYVLTLVFGVVGTLFPRSAPPPLFGSGVVR